jgi:L-threonylcarbamoyladenylate synthase
MEIVKIADVGVDAAAAKAAAVISSGGIVVYPTDTLYGLGVDVLNPDAVDKLHYLKSRDKKKPISILVSSIADMERYTVLTPHAKAFAEKYLPGALTLVLPARKEIPKELTFNGAIGVRIPDDPFSRAFAYMSEYPVTATSANIAGHVPPNTIQNIIQHFGPNIKDIDLFVDGGPRKSEPPSTVVAFVDDEPRVLRDGAIPRKDLGL